MTRRTDLRMKSLLTLRSLLQTMITLASASLGFVSALAWNDAIKATFKKLLLYTYAAVATILAISVVGFLSWVASRIGGEAIINREVDG
jgi:hypothetical protein